MDKPLKDWTLEEILKYCKSVDCGECKLEDFCGNYFGISPNDMENFYGWNKIP